VGGVVVVVMTGNMTLCASHHPLFFVAMLPSNSDAAGSFCRPVGALSCFVFALLHSSASPLASQIIVHVIFWFS
jgi:hypothetical protein